MKLSPVATEGRHCYYVWEKGNLLNVTTAENKTAAIEIKRFSRDRVHGVIVKLGPNKTNDKVLFQLMDDYKRKDGGSIVFRVLKGPKSFRVAGPQNWKLRTMNGVPVHHINWR